MAISLDDQRVFVTGGGAGMGRATVVSMHRLGAKVLTCDIDENALATLPDGVETFACDVSSSKQLDQVFNQISPNGLDILINNAGVSGPTKAVEEISDQEWRSCMSVGIDAQFYCVRRAVPLFKAKARGVIINLISAASILGDPNRSAYVAAKWAVTGFTQT